MHIKGKPLVLLNVWDAGTAKTVAEHGADAIATASWAVAAANGFEDGENLPFALALDNLRRIVAVTDLPVSFDLEAGYGATPEQVATNVGLAIEAGAVGINLEDQVIGHDRLYSVKEQCARISASRKLADTHGFSPFINARHDGYMIANTQESQKNLLQEDLLNEAVERCIAYKNAGADGFFVPGLSDLSAIKSLCEKCPLPVNIMISGEGPDIKQLAELGVSRISQGPAPYLAAMAGLAQMAQGIYSDSPQQS